ncbi:hypothetical protein BDW22DRAFT_1354140 [Trametopsis cervina]|nr:hypothetical protein BDW22DRAFT_1354140 [Trametopsis cervina]
MATKSLTFSNIVFADVQCKGLPSLSGLFIEFVGHLPEELTTADKVPLQVNITVPGKFAAYVRPVLKAVVEHTDTFAEVIEDEKEDDSPMSDHAITFMPLPKEFNHQSSNSWQAMAAEIQSWLNDEVRDTTHLQWQWGLELFWIAYVAAFPDFPSGTAWHDWELALPIDGAFINNWIQSHGDDETDDEDGMDMNGDKADIDSSQGLAPVTRYHVQREHLWREFQQQLGLFYCGNSSAVERV